MVGRMKVGKSPEPVSSFSCFYARPSSIALQSAGVCHRGLKTNERDKQTHPGAVSYHNLRTEEDYREYGRV